MGSVSAMPGLRKMGCGMMVKKYLVLGGLQGKARCDEHVGARLRTTRGSWKTEVTH